jgi:hypothetical protein
VPDATPAPTPAPKVQVQDYAVENYTCTTDGQTLEAISKLKYKSEKYARALRLYNGNAYVGVSETTPLKQGQQLLLPPVQKLEQDFPAEISSYQPSRPAVPAGTPLGSPPPSPLASSSEPPVNLGRPSTDKTVTYTVRPGGEKEWEIARDHLGSSERWVDIYRLNPTIPPEQPVPAGTVLRLPADARN